MKIATKDKWKTIKSPLNYIGGKYKLLNQILPLFPKTDVLKIILNKFVIDKRYTAFIDNLRILPILENGKFTFTYKLIGFEKITYLRI